MMMKIETKVNERHPGYKRLLVGFVCVLTTTLSIFKCDWGFMTTAGDLCLQYQTSQLYWVI